MPFLLYCLTEAEGRVTPPKQGLHGAELRSFENGGLRCFVSETGAADFAANRSVREAARDFNRVLQAILKQAAVIPFRFPTVVADQEELREQLAPHAENYLRALQRLRNVVQMEIRLRRDMTEESQRSVHGGPGNKRINPGREYLRRRQARRQADFAILEDARGRVANLVREWHDSEWGAELRCYALVARSDVRPFRAGLTGWQVPQGYVARVSGPWPATAFLKD